MLSCTDVTLVPSNTWGGQGLLGVSIRFCSFEGASENVWHILVRIVSVESVAVTPLSLSLSLSLSQEVQDNSPASQANLIAHTDYILGSDTMGPEDDLYSVIEASNQRTIRLYVYNSESDSCREVSCYYQYEGKECLL